MTPKQNITGIILAGGQSSRMGTDKGFISLNGILFIEHVINAMKPLVETIVIVSDSSKYDRFGYQQIPDIIENSGPLAGLYSGLSNSDTELNLVLSCDIPLISTDILELLINNNDEEFQVIQFESKQTTMPLIALYKKECLETCKSLLNQGEKRLRQAVKMFRTKTVTLDPAFDQYLQNVNTIEQLKQLRHAIEH